MVEGKLETMRSRSMRLMSLSARYCRAEIATGNFRGAQYSFRIYQELTLSVQGVEQLIANLSPAEPLTAA